MFKRKLAGLAALLFVASCGPGAIDRPPLPAAEARLDVESGMVIASPHALDAPLSGGWECGATCLEPGAETSLVPAPFPCDIAGTFGPRGDADTGTVMWRGEIPAQVSAFALPLAVGPDASPISVIVTIDGAEQRVATVGHDTWVFVRFAVAPSARSRPLAIEISEHGEQWGQWVAAGEPLSLRGAVAAPD